MPAGPAGDCRYLPNVLDLGHEDEMVTRDGTTILNKIKNDTLRDTNKTGMMCYGQFLFPSTNFPKSPGH